MKNFYLQKPKKALFASLLCCLNWSMAEDTVYSQFESKKSQISNQEFRTIKFGFSRWTDELAAWGNIKHYKPAKAGQESAYASEIAVDFQAGKFKINPGLSFSDNPLNSPTNSQTLIFKSTHFKNFSPFAGVIREFYNFSQTGEYHYRRMGSNYQVDSIPGLVFSAHLQLIELTIEDTAKHRQGHGWQVAGFYYLADKNMMASFAKNCLGDNTNCDSSQRDYYQEINIKYEQKLNQNWWMSLATSTISQGATFTQQLGSNTKFESEVYRIELSYKW